MARKGTAPDEVALTLNHSCGCRCEWRAVKPLNGFVLHGLMLGEKPCPWHGGESGEKVDVAVKGLAFTNIAFAEMLSVLLVHYNAEKAVA